MTTIYNEGNFAKYTSKNPLKRMLVDNLNRKIVAQVAHMAAPVSKGRKPVKILDAGCGEGFIDKILRERIDDIEITGLEYTSEALTVARAMNPQVHYVQGDIYKMPFADGEFDIVICTEVLEHLQDPDKALKEINRVSSGKILLTVPHEPWFRLGNVLVGKNLTRWGDPIDHVNHWGKLEFLRFCRENVPADWQLIPGTLPWTMVSSEVE